MKTCFFFGHRDAPTGLRQRLLAEIERCIVGYGVTGFVVGGYGAFDAMAAGAVKEVKAAHPEVSLYLLLPYHPGSRPVATPVGFDGTLYPFDGPVPQRLAILKANRRMVDTCDYFICYAAYPGNARNLLEYAQKKAGGPEIVNLAAP